MSTVNHPTPPEKQYWLDKDSDTRQQWAVDFYINHPDAKRILADFLLKLAHCVRANTHSAMLIVGEPGSGKTKLTGRMKQIATDLYGRQEEEKTICPVIQFAVPNPCTPYEISVAILTALDDPNPRGRKSRAQTMEAAELLLKQCEVRLVLLDNFHDIPARRATRGIELVGTRLRELIDSSAALWVFLGTKESLRVVNSDTQLIKRISYRAVLGYFDIGSKDSGRTFATVLTKADEWLPLAKPSCISEKGNAWRVYLATEGIFDRLVKLIDHGWFLAFSAGREEMSLEDLQEAYLLVHGPRPNEEIPFHPSFVKRRLVDPGDPYETLRGPE